MQSEKQGGLLAQFLYFECDPLLHWKFLQKFVAQKSFKNWHVGVKAMVKLLVSSDINAPYALGG